MSNFLNRLNQGVLLGDGAIGTLLYQRGQPLNASYDALNLQHPEIVSQLHRDYLDAGAHLIETNTFGANRIKLEKFGLAQKTVDINKHGAQLALEVACGRGAFVAGSVGPLSADPSSLSTQTKDSAYREQLEALVSEGVDALFLETFNRLDELAFVLRIARSLGNTPIIASLSFGDDGHTADGLRINEAFSRLKEAGADVVGLNCHFGPTIAEKLLEELIVRPGDLISIYPNAGRPYFYEGRYIYHSTPSYFADFAPKLIAQGARLIGGCCGTTPETIAAMARVLPGLKPVESKQGLIVPPSRISPSLKPAAPRTKSLLELSREKPIIVTELDPPKSLSLDKLLEGAQALKQAGTDFVTLADNSLAILRVSNMAAGFLVKEKTGAEPLIHLACRDKNLIGLQSELMGLHALGIDHVLALTGDPAKVGDHQEATSVYDVNSVGLIRMIKRLNEGFAANGRDLKTKTQFVIGCAFNPNARNLDSQVRKLEDKLEAGAQFVMTQPIFDPVLAKVTHEKTKGLGVPVLVGVMPLLNSRNAEFLHNEVPGIIIPEMTRDRLRGKEGAQANAEGLAISRELCDAVLDCFNGIYLITPLMRYDLTVELSRYVREHVRRPKVPLRHFDNISVD
ncbi:bifunctional homocysteine S-methyltransferase/methylenetetrahydrofolate reductase [Pedosphaera parvula]|uniref:Homocysteine S-methyltransferase n=1 Tax=Pedosphaera parvula (strain Ellin514) TaxID=320771 RepID=B9XKW8_PEDPL|nr:bifunctional homocysteine S-methyltransferase/methylenetetrahydrofolate reductase [Pedosphaera parvula]EEF59462.1 homocysteine S-methyltransferase [Pedosphaera parvula Ellin514]